MVISRLSTTSPSQRLRLRNRECRVLDMRALSLPIRASVSIVIPARSQTIPRTGETASTAARAAASAKLVYFERGLRMARVPSV